VTVALAGDESVKLPSPLRSKTTLLNNGSGASVVVVVGSAVVVVVVVGSAVVVVVVVGSAVVVVAVVMGNAAVGMVIVEPVKPRSVFSVTLISSR
jgi:hypothetical protein